MKGRNIVIVERRYFTGRGGTKALFEFRAVPEGSTLTHALLRDTSFLYAFEGEPHAVELESLMASGQRFQVVD